jgi:hypothetical protein
LNNSAVNSVRASEECRRVLEGFGPRSSGERQFWRYALKAWFNFANPEWLMWKMSQRVPLWRQEKGYF